MAVPQQLAAPVAIEVGREAILGILVCLRRDVGKGATLLDLTADGVAVIPLVSVEAGCRRHPLDEHFTGFAVGDMASSQEEGDRSAKFIGQGTDLGGAAAARSADRLVKFPFFSPAALRWARTAEESMSS